MLLRQPMPEEDLNMSIAERRTPDGPPVQPRDEGRRRPSPTMGHVVRHHVLFSHDAEHDGWRDGSHDNAPLARSARPRRRARLGAAAWGEAGGYDHVLGGGDCGPQARSSRSIPRRGPTTARRARATSPNRPASCLKRASRRHARYRRECGGSWEPVDVARRPVARHGGLSAQHRRSRRPASSSTWRMAARSISAECGGPGESDRRR